MAMILWCLGKVKRFLEYILLHFPKLLVWLLSLKGNVSAEKLHYLLLVSRGSVVIEAGANRGRFSLLFSDLVGNSGRVLSFEPIKKTFEILKARMNDLSFFSNTTLFNTGLGEHSGEIEFFIPREDDQQASRSHLNPGVDVYRELCTMECLDQILIRERVHRMDFLKIDVEGAEYFVIKGGQKSISQYRPMILFEFCPKWIERCRLERHNVFHALMDCGYKHCLRVDNGKLIPFSDAPWDQVTPDSSVDFIAFPDTNECLAKIRRVRERVHARNSRPV